MLSDKWLSRYELLENFNADIPHFENALDFDPVAPSPIHWHGPCGPMTWNESQPHRIPMIQAKCILISGCPDMDF